MEKFMRQSFLNNGVTAHRGNSSEFPENTMTSFESALKTGADWIELDVKKTKDGHLVVIHDDNTARIGNDDVNVSETSYRELRKIDAAYQFRKQNKLYVPECKIPPLSEVITLIRKQGRTRLSIQPKENVVKEVIHMAEKMDALEWIGFNDGNLNLMLEVKNTKPDLPVFWDVGPCDVENNDFIETAKRNHFETIVVYEPCIDKDVIRGIHDAGISAGGWTINDPETMKKLFVAGIDRLYTDHPALCLRIKQSLIKQ